MRLAVVVLVALALALAGCGGGDGDEGADESPAQFAVRITSLLRDGDFDNAWRDLHPAQQKLVDRSKLEACWTQTDDVLNNPDVRLEVTDVADVKWHIPGTSLTSPSKAIEVHAVVPRATGGTRTLEQWTQHAFAVEGQGWTWILAPAMVADARNDVC